MRVLIADDEKSFSAVLADLVRACGHDVVSVVHSGLDAIRAYRQHKPDVVLMDIGLPGMNGYDICRLMRQKPELKDTLFVAQTGWGQQEHRQMASDAGFHHHMVKPVDYDKLQTALEAFAAGRSG